MSIKIEGLDKLQKKLDDLAAKAEELDGEHSVPFNELFNSDFVRRNTKFTDMTEFFSAGGFDASTPEAFKAIDDDALDAHVLNATNFNSWEEMKGAAAKEWISKKLGF